MHISNLSKKIFTPPSAINIKIAYKRAGKRLNAVDIKEKKLGLDSG